MVEGNAAWGDETLGRYSWLRLPSGSGARLTAGSAGARVWIKRHLVPLDSSPPALLSVFRPHGAAIETISATRIDIDLSWIICHTRSGTYFQQQSKQDEAVA